MDGNKKQPMNISISWTQPWPVEVMDDIQLEMLVQDLLFDECDTVIACEMLNRIGIQT